MITYEWSDWRNGWFWWIQSVYVREDHAAAASSGRCTSDGHARAPSDRRRGRHAPLRRARQHAAQATYEQLGMIGRRLSGPRSDVRKWPGRDSNPHALRHRLLRPACLPVTPPGLPIRVWVSGIGDESTRHAPYPIPHTPIQKLPFTRPHFFGIAPLDFWQSAPDVSRAAPDRGVGGGRLFPGEPLPMRRLGASCLSSG